MIHLCPHQTLSLNVVHFMQRWLAVVLFTVSSLALVVAGDALPVRPQAKPYLDVPSAPPVPSGGLTITPAFPKLFFQGAIAVRPVPGTNRLWVLEREGRIWSFENDPATSTKILVLDLNDDDLDPETPPTNGDGTTPGRGHMTAGTRWWCQGWDDCGLMGLAFHPEFGQVGSPNRGFFYIGYQAKSIPPDFGGSPIYRPSSSGGARNTSNRLARFTVPDSSVSADPSSEQILVDQIDTHLWHNGGEVFFDNQGYLYTVNGDGGSAFDPYQHSQRISKGLFSGVMRIDVDWTPSSTRSHAPPARQAGQPPLYPGYGIPNDNPFVNVPGALQEFYAIGLRSPHRMTYDSVTEQILIGDIGQNNREEMTKVTRGSNHQWGYMEGFANKSIHSSIRNERIPPTYVTGAPLAAGALSAALAYTAPTTDTGLPPGMLAIGDYVRFGSQVTRIATLSAYPHTSVTFETSLTQDVLSATPMTRTTGFVVNGAITSIANNDNVPSGLGSTTIPVSGSGLLSTGTCVSFGVANAFGSYQIIAASDDGTNTTSITVRPRIPATAVLPTSTWVDRLTVIGNEQPPVADFNHGGTFGFNSIIGGYIYRGTAHPLLNGQYIFADNARGTIYSMENINSYTPTIKLLLAIPNYASGASGYRGLSGFGTDHQNELLICLMQGKDQPTNKSTGQIWKFIRSSGTVDNPTVIGDPIPTDLAKTGAFVTDAAGQLIIPLQPSPALIPYGVNSPLWSDNAKKARWISIPNPSGKTSDFDPVSEQITYRPTGEWSFPAGTVFVKHFELDDYAFADHRRKLETRLLVRSPDNTVYGVTYIWNDTGTSARLLEKEGYEHSYDLLDENGGISRQKWTYPSRDDCLSCHNTNANHVLGVNSRQLNGVYNYSGVSANQLETWSHSGLFSNPPSDAIIPSLTKTVEVNDTNAKHADRVRSWLDANCSHCHRPGGVHAEFDARFDTPLVDQALINGAVTNMLGVADARVIAPGSLSRSLLHTRDNSIANAIKMPPLAKNMVDTDAMTALEEWIAGMAVPLTVAMTSPTSGAVVRQPDSIVIAADTNAHLDVSRVEFFIDGVLIGSDASAPYALTWTPTVIGQHSVSAMAYANGGQTATTPQVFITVNAPIMPPVIVLTSPAVDATIPAPGALILSADASDSDGSIALVEFLKNGVVIASTTSAPFTVPVYNLGAGTWIFSARATDNDGATTLSAPVSVTVSGISGLTATYYEHMDFTGVSLTRTDAHIDFDWSDVDPAPGIQQDTFSVRWLGTVTAPVTGTWTFITTSDEGIRVWIDGQPLISNWTNHASTEDTGTITMTAGEARTIRVEYYENEGPAVARLEWSGPGMARGLVPQAAMIPLINVAPSVNAGVDLVVTLPASATLDATVSDDNLPTGTVVSEWTKVSGPGVVTFGNSNDIDTTATFSLAGTYVLRLSVSDGDLATSDEVAVSVTNATGTILREWWTGIAGTAVAKLTGVANYPALPSGSGALTAFEIPINVMDNYGTRVRGYVVPPITGSYIFWIAGDDNCQLFLGTNASAMSKVLIASVPGWTNSRDWVKYTAQKSVAVTLTAGVEYYIEALHKEGGGGDNLAVGWQLPDGVLERPIPGMRLKPFSPASFPLPQVTLVTPLAGVRMTAPGSVTLSADATDADGPITKLEFLENGTVVAALTAPPWSYTRSGLSAGAYTYLARATDADGQMNTSAARSITVINEDQTGLILREWWSGIAGAAVANLTNAPVFPGIPTGSSLQSLFEAPTNWAENYGTRMSGYVVAPTTGAYVFWIAGDDNCQLWLSTNDSPASKVLIASVTSWTNSREWTRYPSQKSAIINLVAGSRYYIEALHKEAGGGDNLAVGWQLPSGVLERPIPGSRLMPPLVTVASLPVGWSVRRR